MRTTFQRGIALALAYVVLPNATFAATAVPLDELVKRPYLALSEQAPDFSFTHEQLEAFRKDLARQRKAEDERLRKEEKDLDSKLKDLRDQLSSLNKETSSDTPAAAATRQRVHCEILSLEKTQREKRVERQTGMPVSFDNKLAKVDLIERWPALKQGIVKTIADGKARQRIHGDVEDIGVRKGEPNQEKDIKLGEDALKDLKLHSLMPREVENKDIKNYVQTMADRIAANSDVKVPVKLTILHSEEINAFALPGGFLFVNTGLIDKTATDSELAGVVAHELAHVAARHGAKLTKRANVANMLYQMAQIAVMIGTGGFGTIGTYYLFQAGFLGLGLFLDLSLLGVNREFEAEADQLGAQYAWKSGYDPRGFITFFDTMASEKGYIQSASFFRTHPPYFERILSTLSEVEYLPKSTDAAIDSSAFHKMKTALTEELKQEKQRTKDAPSLRREPPCPEENKDKKDKKDKLSDAGSCFVCAATE